MDEYDVLLLQEGLQDGVRAVLASVGDSLLAAGAPSAIDDDMLPTHGTVELLVLIQIELQSIEEPDQARVPLVEAAVTERAFVGSKLGNRSAIVALEPEVGFFAVRLQASHHA